MVVLLYSIHCAGMVPDDRRVIDMIKNSRCASNDASLRELSCEEVLLVSGGVTQGPKGAQASGVEVADVTQGPKGAQASGVEVAG
jgi:hypothetical protein